MQDIEAGIHHLFLGEKDREVSVVLREEPEKGHKVRLFSLCGAICDNMNFSYSPSFPSCLQLHEVLNRAPKSASVMFHSLRQA